MRKSIGRTYLVVLILLMCAVAAESAPAEQDTTPIWNSAMAALQSGDHAKAIPLLKEFREAIQFRTTLGCLTSDAYTMFLIAGCYENLKMSADAREWYKRIVTTRSMVPDLCSEAQYKIGQLLENDRLRSQVWPEMDKLLASYPTQRRLCASALLLKGNSQRMAKRYAEAIVTLGRVEKEYADQPEFCIGAKELLIEATLQSGKFREAAPMLDTVRDDLSFSKGTRARFALWTGQCCQYFNEDEMKAEEWFSKVIADFGDTPAAAEAYLHRALCRIRRSEYDEASVDIAKIKSPMMQHYGRATLHSARGNAAQAAAEFEQAVQNLPMPYEGAEDLPITALKRLGEIYDSTRNTGGAASARQRLVDFRAALKAARQ